MNCVFDKDEVLELTDKRAAIRELLGEPASERGDEWTYHCRFHDDQNPSFSINVGSGLWTCHGCDACGDLFRLVEQVEGVSFKEALAWLADRAGVNETRPKRTSRTTKKPLTVAEYAAAKRLPADWLRRLFGLSDGPGGVLMPYYDTEGKPTGRTRIRSAMTGDRRFHWAKGSEPILPYALRFLSKAQERFDYCVLAEGESDVHAGVYHKFPVFGVPGAKAFKPEWTRFFVELGRVYLMHEPDSGGDAFVSRVSKALADSGFAGEIRQVVLPDGVKDLSELHIQKPDEFHSILQAALEASELIDVVEVGARAEASQGTPNRRKAAAAPGELPAAAPTDLGRAEVLLARFGIDWRYIAQTGEDRRWDGRRWAEDLHNQKWADSRAVRSELYQLASQTKDNDLRKAYAELAFSFEKASNVAGAWRFFQGMPGVVALPSDFDRDPMALNTLNGTVDLRNGTLRPHQRDDLITKLAPTNYDPDARCPKWEAFLRKVMADNEELISFLQRALGYSLTGDTSEQSLFILHGSGANGKSVLVKTVAQILGDYSQTARIETFTARKGSDIPEDVASLQGARLVVTSETSMGQRLAEGLVKTLTGEDVVRARKLYQNSFQFVPQFKLWMACNHKPVIKGTDEGIWRRIRLVPFNVRIPPEEQDRKLAGKLMEEASGILAWMVRGCLAWQQHGLQPPEAVQAATADYRAESDSVGRFLGEDCVVNPLARVAAKDLYSSYLFWCEQAGEKPLSQKAFGDRLRREGFEPRRGAKGVRQWVGVGLLEDGPGDGCRKVTRISGTFENTRLHEELTGTRVTIRHLSPTSSGGQDESDESAEPW